jgi:hypothetical protein
MRGLRGVAALVLVGLVSIATLPVWAGTEVKYSGQILGIDPQSGALTIADVGPWRTVAGKTQIDQHRVTLTASTQYSVFMRVNAPGRFPGEFVEVPLEVTDLSVGDFVTVECVRQQGRLVALKVAMADLSVPE